MKRDTSLFIDDILENIELIEKSVKKLSKEKFKLNRLIVDATIRRLEIIGEAVKNIPNALRVRYPEIPWKNIAGFRDVIIHGYFGIDLDLVWKIIKEDLIKLKKDIQRVSKEFKK